MCVITNFDSMLHNLLTFLKAIVANGANGVSEQHLPEGRRNSEADGASPILRAEQYAREVRREARRPVAKECNREGSLTVKICSSIKIIAYPSTLTLLYILLYYYPLDSDKDFHSI